MGSNLYEIDSKSSRLKIFNKSFAQHDIERGLHMNNFLYTMYAVILAALSIFTGEIITFIMLGFILITLQNIHSTLKDILKVKSRE